MRLCICEDDALYRDHCRSMLSSLAEKYSLDIEVKEFESGDSLLFEAEDIAPVIDILLLDIGMPGTDGISVARDIKKYDFTGVVIFLTKSNTHYPDAFDVRAFNYIEKEFLDTRFEKVFLEAVNEVKDRNEEYIILTCAGVTRNIPISKIQYFEVNHAIVTVHYGEEESFDFYSTLEKLGERLYCKNFMRVQRSFLVNLAAVREKKSDELVMNNGSVVPIGRGKRKEVNNMLFELGKLK